MTDGYRDRPIPPPKSACHIRGRRHGDLCCACPYEAQCREAVMRGSPIACERKIGRDGVNNVSEVAEVAGASASTVRGARG